MELHDPHFRQRPLYYSTEHSAYLHLRQRYLTDWDSFRRACEHYTPPEVNAASLQEWVTQLIDTKRQHDQLIDPDIPAETVDTSLQHLWDTYRSSQRRWRRQKHNRQLRLKLANIGKTIEACTAELTRAQ